jgi:uncharacterized damage-inducible protein DinB
MDGVVNWQSAPLPEKQTRRRHNMATVHEFPHRRDFLKSAAGITAGAATLGLVSNCATIASAADASSQNPAADAKPQAAGALAPTGPAASRADASIIGPKAGLTPQVGTMASMLTWIQHAVVTPVKDLTRADLDWLFDANANSIGALLLHLAATETYYQFNTFDGMKWGGWSDAVKQKWDAAMNLGAAGRSTIKGHDLDFYLTALSEARDKTLEGFRKRDDAWLMTVDQTWPWGPTNNYCKWFHVCEHESHHAGQIDLLIKRLPGAKPAKES